MDMINIDDVLQMVVSDITLHYEDYEEDNEKFIKATIEEYIDNTDIDVINNIYECIIDDVNLCVEDYKDNHC